MSIEAMKLALEALEYIDDGVNNQGAHTGISWRCVSNKAQPAITSLRIAIAEFDSHTLYREGYVNGYAFGEAAGNRKSIANAEQSSEVQKCCNHNCNEGRNCPLRKTHD